MRVWGGTARKLSSHHRCGSQSLTKQAYWSAACPECRVFYLGVSWAAEPRVLNQILFDIILEMLTVIPSTQSLCKNRMT